MTPNRIPLVVYADPARWELRRPGAKVRAWTPTDVAEEAIAYYDDHAATQGAVGRHAHVILLRDFGSTVAEVAADPAFAHLLPHEVQAGVVRALALRARADLRASYVSAAYTAAQANARRDVHRHLMAAWLVGGGPGHEPPPRAWHALLRLARSRRRTASPRTTTTPHPHRRST